MNFGGLAEGCRFLAEQEIDLQLYAYIYMHTFKCPNDACSTELFDI